jgi:muramoyltetrapeptide carboxypeptidase
MAQVWQALQDGDIVDMIAPGFAVSDEILKSCADFLRSWNLQPRWPKNIFKKNLICANTDEARFAHLRAALLAGDSKVIWCLRGGYGSVRLLPELAKMKKPSQAKLLIGISDICSLHCYLNEYWNWPSLHGALLDRFGQKRISPAIQREMKNLLWGKTSDVLYRGLKPLNDPARRVKSLRGPVVGGNLITLQSAMGTPYDFSLKNKILLLEDIGERGYGLDRALVHFVQAGKLKGCRGILFGHFTGGDEPGGGNLVKKALNTWAQEIQVPVFSGIESGHDVKLRPVPLNTSAVLSLESSESSKKFQIRIESGVAK